MSKYEFTELCDEISGFSGIYEEGCRKMVIAGMEWMDKNPDVKLNFKEFQNITGVIIPENIESEKLTDYMNESIGGEATGAMMQACINHVTYASKHGWDKYMKLMEARCDAKSN